MNDYSPVYRRCGCTAPATGRRCGDNCPRLADDPGHGSWYFSVVFLVAEMLGRLRAEAVSSAVFLGSRFEQRVRAGQRWTRGSARQLVPGNQTRRGRQDIMVDDPALRIVRRRRGGELAPRAWG
jgi:hypothetical protein